MGSIGPIRGTFAAIYTPFTAEGRVDQQALEGLCERLVDAGVGLIPCGTTGETPTLTQAEFGHVVRTAVRINRERGGKQPVIAGTGTSATRSTIDNTRQALECGADAALVVTPPYNKPPQRSIIAHFRAVADEGGLPVVLYNVPSRTGTNMRVETTLELAQHPNIIAIKESAGSCEQVQQLIAGAPTGFSVLSGDDATALSLVLDGGAGVVSVAANLVPEAVATMIGHGLRGELAPARRLQRELLPLFSALFQTANPIPLKRAAAQLGHAAEDVRLPLTTDALTPAMADVLVAALERAQGAVSG